MEFVPFRIKLSVCCTAIGRFYMNFLLFYIAIGRFYMNFSLFHIAIVVFCIAPQQSYTAILHCCTENLPGSVKPGLCHAKNLGPNA